MGKRNKPKINEKKLVLHPNSRKTRKLAKNHMKTNAKEKCKLVHQVKQNLIGEKMLWFKEHLLPDVGRYNEEQTIEIIELYLKRFDEELEQIALKNSIGHRSKSGGRLHASRGDIIKITNSQDKEEFETCGIECPDFMNPVQLSLLRKWEGELRFLPNFKLKRFSKKVLLKAIHQRQNKSSVTPITTSCDMEIC